MVSLCKRAVDMSDSTLMDNVTEAYPLVVFCKQLENKQRRLMEIMECEILPNGTRRYNSIYRYHITKNHYENGNYIIEGYHERHMDISQSLQRRLVDNGMPDTQLQLFLRKEVETA
jgi:pilus assembly protein CpaF